MKRMLLSVVLATMAVAVGVPAGAQPRQSATGSGTSQLTVVTAPGSVTWGPWHLTGAWRTDDNAVFVGPVAADAVTTYAPVPSSVVPDFTIHGANATGSLTGTCNGVIVRQLTAVLELSLHCVDTVSGATLAADADETMFLVAERRHITAYGVTTTYRGTFTTSDGIT